MGNAALFQTHPVRVEQLCVRVLIMLRDRHFARDHAGSGKKFQRKRLKGKPLTDCQRKDF